MGRVNKTTEGVFVAIVGDESTMSSYDLFIKKDGETKEIKPFLEQYRSIVTKTKTEMEKMAMLEEIIMQMRAKTNLSDVKLSLVREYIYARCPFYRRNKTAKEIRVIVDNVKTWGDNMDKLSENKEFMSLANNKIAIAMQREIDDNIKVYKALHKK